MNGFVVKIHDGIDWRYVSASGFAHVLKAARIYRSEDEAEKVATHLRRTEGVRAHVNEVVA